MNLRKGDVSLREALELIFAGSGEQWGITPDVADIRITLNLQGVSQQQALRLVIRQGALIVPGLAANHDSDYYVISRRAARSDDLEGPFERLMTVHFQRQPLSEALQRLSAASGLVFYSLTRLPEVPVTLEADQVPVRVAVYQLFRQAAAEVPNLTLDRAYGKDPAPWILQARLPFLVPAVQADDPDVLTRQALAAAQAGNLAEAVALAGRVVAAVPKEPRSWLLRARLYDAQDEYARAAADYSEVLKLDPKSIAAWQGRGEVRFKAGQIKESVEDFDELLKLAPEKKPHHWQRGIALYYAGRYADGKQQFALHQTVNPHDVENAVWHFLCTARAEGREAARKQLIPTEGDPRIPMAQVHRLFAGKGTPAEVLAAAEAAPERTRAGEPRFYAHLYLGLYYEATGDAAKAREYILKAAERARQNGYMGDVARVHAGILQQGKPK